MKTKYAIIVLGTLLVIAAVALVRCNSSEAPAGFDPTEYPR